MENEGESLDEYDAPETYVVKLHVESNVVHSQSHEASEQNRNIFISGNNYDSEIRISDELIQYCSIKPQDKIDTVTSGSLIVSDGEFRSNLMTKELEDRNFIGKEASPKSKGRSSMPKSSK